MEKHFKSPVGDSETITKKAEAGGSENTKNAFLNASTKHDTRTENMALSHSSSGNKFVDDFSKSGSYRGRDTKDIFKDASFLWNINPALAMKLFLYLRLITRRIKGFYVTETVQKGQGNRDESLRRLLWVAYTHPAVFYKNLWLIPLVGSFKDLWTLMGMDYKGELDHSKFFDLMVRAFATPDLHALAVKYMPQIRAKSKLKTDRARVLNALAKEFAKFMQMSYAEYRKFKSENGHAHKWQQLISQGYYDQLNFNAIPGKALSNLVKGKFLTNNNLVQAYTKWIESQPIAKFTGYVYELMSNVTRNDGWGTKVNPNLTNYQEMTANKQFEGLIELAKKDRGGLQGNVWCALDTSGSMAYRVTEKVTAMQIGMSLGIYFSALNEGAFKDDVIMFNSTSKKLTLKGSFIDRIRQIPMNAMGSTNFQSVIDEIVRIRTQNPYIPIKDYPETLLVVSDMQFNPSGGLYNTYQNEQTNYEMAMSKLEAVQLPRMNIIWWQVTGRTEDVPVRADDKGTMMLSGFDGAVITEILGGSIQKPISEITPEDAMRSALSQEILEQVNL